MNCVKWAELVERFVDGEASAQERTDVALHLEECQACSDHLVFLRGLDAGVASGAPAEPPPEYWDRLPLVVGERLRGEMPARAPRRGFLGGILSPAMFRFASAAAMITLVAVVFFATRREASLPEEIVATPATEAPSSSQALPETTADPVVRRGSPSQEPRQPSVARDEGPSDPAPVEAPRPASPAARARSEAAGEAPALSGAVALEERALGRRALSPSEPPKLSSVQAATSGRVLDCDAARSYLEANEEAGPRGRDARFEVALCSIREASEEPSEERRALAREDAAAFLELEGSGARAEEIRRELDALAR